MIIGIFGKSGSGKSSVCEYLSKKGFYVIDADKLGHKILKKGEEGYEKVINAFGSSFLENDGEINRKKLGKYVFENKKADILSSISHPIIEKLVEKEIKTASASHNNIIIDGALLCNTKIKNMCELLILIKSDRCVERIKKRDGISEETATARLASQSISDTADIIMENNGAIEELYKKTDEFLRKEISDYE